MPYRLSTCKPRGHWTIWALAQLRRWRARLFVDDCESHTKSEGGRKRETPYYASRLRLPTEMVQPIELPTSLLASERTMAPHTICLQRGRAASRHRSQGCCRGECSAISERSSCCVATKSENAMKIFLFAKIVNRCRKSGIKISLPMILIDPHKA